MENKQTGGKKGKKVNRREKERRIRKKETEGKEVDE